MALINAAIATYADTISSFQLLAYTLLKMHIFLMERKAWGPNREGPSEQCSRHSVRSGHLLARMLTTVPLEVKYLR